MFSAPSGRNAGYRHAVPRFEEWEKNHGYDLSSDSSSDSGEESDKDKEKGRLITRKSLFISFYSRKQNTYPY